MAIIGFLTVLFVGVFLLLRAASLIGAIVLVKQLSGGAVVGMYVLLAILLSLGGGLLYAAFYWMPFTVVAGLK